jgi:nitrite reductase/ring-hydroxylating ferredoxin subunit
MFVKLCDKKIITVGELRAFKIKGHEVLVTSLNGKIFCLDARCTHAGAPLAEGTLYGEVLTCPWHYSQFNITNGMVLRGPTQKLLKTYNIEEREDFLFVDL